MTTPSNLNRRSFLFVFGGALMSFAFPAAVAPAVAEAADNGTVALPPLPEASAEGAAPTVRRVIGPVLWSDAPQPHLLWVENVKHAAEPQVMLWVPETEEEFAEAHRFYDASRWKPYHSFEELRRRPRLRGRFVVRWWTQSGHVSYLRLDDESRLFPVPPVDAECWCTVPEEAAHFGHGQAIELTVRLAQAYGHDPAPLHGMFLEPVRREDALASHPLLVL